MIIILVVVIGGHFMENSQLILAAMVAVVLITVRRQSPRISNRHLALAGPSPYPSAIIGLQMSLCWYRNELSQQINEWS